MISWNHQFLQIPRNLPGRLFLNFFERSTLSLTIIQKAECPSCRSHISLTYFKQHYNSASHTQRSFGHATIEKVLCNYWLDGAGAEQISNTCVKGCARHELETETSTTQSISSLKYTITCIVFVEFVDEYRII